jgi:hypothetical protein
MTYKTIQAETKLLSAVLHSHGMREVSKKSIYSSLFIALCPTGICQEEFDSADFVTDYGGESQI